MTKVKVLKPFEYKRKKREVKEIVEMLDSIAEEVIKKGYGERIEEKIPVFGESGESRKTKTTQKPTVSKSGLDVSRYVKSSGWVTSDDVEEGDELEVLGPGRMDDRFDTEYLVIPVRHQGVELELRLGKRNTKRIVDKFGPNTGDWIGKKIKVAAVEEYLGLGTKGLILQPAGE